ncbi:MAG TPA: FAD-binding oxidoreductase [Ilumatobacteraceae bacterium]|nr:FAD-binding oxidoreductase [Ilumatobacteraceae bacterium]
MPTSPTPPIELLGTASRISSTSVEVPEEALAALASICETIESDTGSSVDTVAEASRDWWPLALHWALAGQVPRLAEVVVRPTSTDEVVRVVQVCNNARLPLTVTGGRSGVCGAAAPVFGGVVLDATSLCGVIAVDDVSGIVDVLPGTFGPDLEHELRTTHGLSVGHFPQSFDLATVGGWVASRGAGQYSTRYGKIEDMVVGLEAVLADGTVIRTGGAPAAAAGPDLTQLLVGSEGTLAVITRVWLRTHPVPTHERRAAYAFGSFADGIEACRHVLQAGATPAVLRLYDAVESQRGQGGDGTQCMLLVLDEGHVDLVDATMSIVDRAALARNAQPMPESLVDAWMGHRNDTSALQGLTRKGFVVDTMEIAAPWSRLDTLFGDVRAALLAVPHARAATCHLSHSYPDGACLYFTFAATPPAGEVESTYVAMWDAGQRAVLAGGGNLSHHHGVGLNRGRFMAEALGTAHGVLAAIKSTLDPNGIMNPGKLGLASPFGEVAWP